MHTPAGRSWSDALTLSETTGTYRAQLDETWAQGRSAFGGLVAGWLVRALERHMPADRTLRSALIQFIAPVNVGDVELHAEMLRGGRALTQGQARLSQNGALCAQLIAAFGAPRATAITLAGPQPPPLVAAESIPEVPYVEGTFPRFTQHFDFRWDLRRIPFTGSARASIGGYIRHRTAPRLDSAALLGLVDAWPGAVLTLAKRPAPASTVTWMIDVLAPLAAVSCEGNPFYRYEAEGVAADGGYASVDARLWAADGRLLAASRQLIAEFSEAAPAAPQR